MAQLMRPILEVARELGLRDDDVEPYGRGKAKVSLRALGDPPRRAGRLVLVSAINPTPAGEGKTTTAIALAMGMRRLGRRPVLALRQPSLGPLFGIKGGGTGGGRATLEPSDDINVHFTGDIHAIASAHNLLSSLVDNALHWRDRFAGSELDPRAVTWGRVLDSEDRFLRRCVIGLGGPAHGVPRERALRHHGGERGHGHRRAGARPRGPRGAPRAHRGGLDPRRHARDGRGPRCVRRHDGPAARRAQPNLVQTAEGGPALVHAGPFGNIAHGCSSIVATRLAMRLGDYAITEAGFGFDLGGEKFLDIKCRAAGFWPRAVVLVVTLAGPARRTAALDHLDKHLESVASFGLPVVVALNAFDGDPPDAADALARAMASRGVPFAVNDAHERGGEGALELAGLVCEVVDGTDAAPPAPRFLYGLDEPPEAKARAIARTVYGARDVVFTSRAQADLARCRAQGGDGLPALLRQDPPVAERRSENTGSSSRLRSDRPRGPPRRGRRHARRAHG